MAERVPGEARKAWLAKIEELSNVDFLDLAPTILELVRAEETPEARMAVLSDCYRWLMAKAVDYANRGEAFEVGAMLGAAEVVSNSYATDAEIVSAKRGA